MVLMSHQIVDLHLVGAGSATQCFPFYTYDEDGGNRRENITDWALEQFQAHYDDPTISKWDVFYYVYALLHHPQYRQQFAAHLKKELPRVPFLGSPSPLGEGAGVRAVARIGQRLAELHLGYETGPRARLTWQTSGTLDYRVSKMKRVGNSIVYNHTLTLADIPASAWGYKLGSRSALEWLIDQYQVKKDKAGNVISDPNAASDDPQHLVKLIERVAYLSAETVRLVEALGEVKLETS
jgi:predicted helicase